MRPKRLWMKTLLCSLIAIPAVSQGKSPRAPLDALYRAKVWLNAEPLAAADLRGKVVLIDFWTYTCIHWRRALPSLRAGHEKHRDDDLVVIGVHTPECGFEQGERRIAYRFPARDVHLVMGPSTRGTPVRFRVSIDRHPPGPSRGVDVDADGAGTFREPRMHQLIRQPGPIADREFEIEFLDPGAQVFVFMFG